MKLLLPVVGISLSISLCFIASAYAFSEIDTPSSSKAFNEQSKVMENAKLGSAAKLAIEELNSADLQADKQKLYSPGRRR